MVDWVADKTRRQALAAADALGTRPGAASVAGKGSEATVQAGADILFFSIFMF
jgi:hypothetical protein